MFVQIRLIKGYQQPLIYSIPSNWKFSNLNGKIITVPFRNKSLPALVINTFENLSFKPAFSIRQAQSLNDFPEDNYYNLFVHTLASKYLIDPLSLYQRTFSLIQKSSSKQDANDNNQELYNLQQIDPSPTQLTEEQSRVVDFVSTTFNQQKHIPTLLHGVTSSGKTEVYSSLIKQIFKMNKTTILLLPEVSLSLQFQHIFKKKLPLIPVFSFHSATSQKEKNELWGYLINKKPVLIIGVHLPIILPIANLGIIIVDEEHDSGFREKKHPKICSKDAALLRSRISKVPILLGSATPSLQSLYQVKQKKWNFFQLKKRFKGRFPKINIVSLKEKTTRRRSFWISRELETAIQKTLAQKKQILIYLNRRGFSFFVTCKECSFIFKCSSCSVSLTLHNNQREELRCHYCNSSKYLPESCPGCSAPKKMFLKKGIGTQQALSIIKTLFPTARIERADLDTTCKKRMWHETVKKFEDGEIDILVGTQTITKGYHFPNVTLVGILWGDLNLNFPLYNAGEITLQQLVQVAGRAGRQSDTSTVIIQVMNKNPIFKYLNEKDYLQFYKNEIEFRSQCSYPPVYNLTTIEFHHSNPIVIDNESRLFAKKANEWCLEHKKDIKILGPAKPIVYRIQKTETRQILFKALNNSDLHSLCKSLKQGKFKSTISIIPSAL